MRTFGLLAGIALALVGLFIGLYVGASMPTTGSQAASFAGWAAPFAGGGAMLIILGYIAEMVTPPRPGAVTPPREGTP